MDMNPSSSSTPTCTVQFSTKSPYVLPSQKFMIPSSWKRYQLSQLINKALGLAHPVPFDFIIKGGILRGSLEGWCAENGVGEEETLDIEYIESVLPPQKISDLSHDDWVSSVSCGTQGYFITSSYDGFLRAFDYSRKLTSSFKAHDGPVTSFCIIPSADKADDNSENTTKLVGTASLDHTAQVNRFKYKNDTEESSDVLATLHLHTSPLSSISSNPKGSHLLTSSWDNLIGLWDTSIPSSDEIPEKFAEDGDGKKKRRKLTSSSKRPPRKAPIHVLKSHTARVSKAVFGKVDDAYSCGFDSTVRTWDVENGLCTHTITASEKAFLDLTLTSDFNVVLAASMDRTVMLYDLRTSSTSATSAVGALSHSSTPSCLVSGSARQPNHVMTGGYDGIVRIWDLRSMNGAIIAFRAWDGRKKVLGIDWQHGLAGIGGEGGLEIWKAAEEVDRISDPQQ